jgi:hypothetical protein
VKADLIGPDGKEYAFDGDDAALSNAKAKGFRVASEIGAVDTALDTAKAAGLAAVQGASAGLFGAAATGAQADEESPENAQSRWHVASELKRGAEEHPVASTLGEMAGMLTSPLNALTPALEGERAATVAGRLGQKVASNAAVGSLFGAGNAVSDAALGDAPLTAEKLVAGAGLGALLGGLGGGIGGAIEEGAAKVLPKLSTVLKGGQSALDGIADDFALKSFRNTKAELSKFSEAQLADAVKVTRERGHLRLSPEEMAQAVRNDVAGVGKTKGAFLDAADAGSVKPDFKAALDALDQHVAGMSPLEREAVAGPVAKARAALEDIATDPRLGTWRAFDKWKQDLQAMAKFSRGAAEDDLALGLKRQLAGVARAELDRQLVPALGADGQKFLDTKALYGSLKTAESLAVKGAKRPGGFSLTDIASAAVGGGIHPLGIVAGLGAKFIREHGAAVAARIADSLAKSPALEAVAQSFAKTLPAVAPKLGPYGQSLLLAAERAPTLALAQHIVTAQADPTYAAHARLAGLNPETPDEHQAALKKGTDIAAMHAAMKAHDDAIDEGLSHVIKGTKPARASAVLKTQDFGSKQLRQDSRAAHTKRVEEVRRLSTDPKALIDLVAKNTATLTTAPAVAGHLTAVADRAVKYLARQAETPPKPGPLAREWTPTDAERHKFALQLEAVQEPMSVLRHAAAGTLTQSQLSAVAAVYPSLYGQLRDKALERLVGGEPVPYRARLMLSMLAGVDPDGTLNPRSIAMNQHAIANAQGKPSERMPAPQPEPDTKMRQAERTALPSERRQLGRLEGT